MVIICPKCGRKMLDHEKFCPGCGTPRPAYGQPISSAPMAQGGGAPCPNMPPAGQPPFPQTSIPSYSAAPVKKSILPAVLIAVSCTLLAGALVFAAVRLTGHTNADGSSPKNAAAMDPEASMPKNSDSGRAASKTPAHSDTPSATPAPVKTPTATPAPSPTPYVTDAQAAVKIEDILTWTTEEQAIAAFGEPKSRKNVEYDDADGVALVYDHFRIEFYLEDGKTHGLSQVIVDSNMVPIEIYALAVGMTVSEAETGLKDAGYEIYSEDKSDICSYSEATGKYIFITLKNSMITKISVG